MKTYGTFAPLIQGFFTERLMGQRQASPHTVAAYRDSFRLLLEYAEKTVGKSPTSLHLEDLDAALVGKFLEHLEKERGNSARTRNARLAAIHSFYRYVAFQEPSYGSHTQRVLAIPNKRANRPLVPFLSKPEIDALLAAPDRRTWSGRRDYAFLMLAIQTGLRVSELTGLRCQDVTLGTGANVRCQGKGRKDRATPIGKQLRRVLRDWLREREADPSAPIFPNARGGPLSRDGVQYLLTKRVGSATMKCATLKGKRVSPHVLRHTTAMNLLLEGVDTSVIALWLGHESPETTRIYLQANLAMKEKIVKKGALVKVPPGRYKAGDKVLAFLKGL